MGHIRTFLLGVATAFCFYYITKKGDDGKSILDDVLDHPSDIIGKAKELAIAEVVKAVKKNF